MTHHIIMKIAIIGAGISGMVSAYLLAEEHEVTVFEANDYIGGHTHTLDIEVEGSSYPVDTGFIVFNERTYPNFLKLLNRLNVAWQDSDMSFSITCQRTGLEYKTSPLNALFAQRTNLFTPRFYKMLWDVLRFRREAPQLLTQEDDTLTLGSYLREHRYSQMFIDYFIIPMGAAIWSTSAERFMDFPARYFVEFFSNHGLLSVKQPQWFVIQGGSKQYIPPLTASYRDRIRLDCPVESVRRFADYVEVKPRGHDIERFDHVVIAAHSDQALAMLADPSDAERDILEAIPYQENLTILHTDSGILPKRPIAWASWNYMVPREAASRVTLTYYMNLLQSLTAPVDFCVSLNLPEQIEQSKILERLTYAHPLYTPKGRAAQTRREEINGVNRTYFCGAYWSYGFHEDGVKSALAVCQHFGKTL